MNEAIYRPIGPEEVNRALFRSFERRQVVDRCWRREGGQWVIRQDPFVDQWSESDYAFLVTCLRQTLSKGGVVLGAFWEGKLKGFASVEHPPWVPGASTGTSPACMCPRSSGVTVWAAAFLTWQRIGPGNREEKSCIFPVTPPWRPRPFTVPWVAGRQRSTARSM